MVSISLCISESKSLSLSNCHEPDAITLTSTDTPDTAINWHQALLSIGTTFVQTTWTVPLTKVFEANRPWVGRVARFADSVS